MKPESPQLDRFADYLAEGWKVRDAAREMGLSPLTGDKMLQRLRRRLGPQAV